MVTTTADDMVGKLDEATALLRKLTFDARGPLAWLKKRGEDSPKERLMGINKQINNSSSDSDKDYSAAARVMMKKMEEMSDDAITADVTETRALLKKLGMIEQGILVIADEVERDELTQLAETIKKALKDDSSLVDRASKFMEDKMPDMLGMITSITGSPLAGSIISTAMKGIQAVVLKTQEKSEQTKLMREMLDATKEERLSDTTPEKKSRAPIEEAMKPNSPQRVGEEEDMTDLMELQLEEQRTTNELLDKMAPTLEEKADADHYRRLMLKNERTGPDDGSMGKIAGMMKGLGGQGFIGEFLSNMLGGMAGGAVTVAALKGLVGTLFLGLGKGILFAVKKFPIVAVVWSAISGIFTGIKELAAGGGVKSALSKGLSEFADSMIKIFTFGLFSLEKLQDILNKFADVIRYSKLGKAVAKILEFFGVETADGESAVDSTAAERSTGGVDTTGTTGGKGSAPASAGAAAEDRMIKFFVGKGYPEHQAIGIVANLKHESSLDHKVKPGDGGRAVGLAQWHPNRQARFKKVFGKDLKDATEAEQLEFVHYEIQNPDASMPSGKIREKLSAANTAGEAAAVVSRYYEAPAARDHEMRVRAATANQISDRRGGTVVPAALDEEAQARADLQRARAKEAELEAEANALEAIIREPQKVSRVVTDTGGQSTTVSRSPEERAREDAAIAASDLETARKREIFDQNVATYGRPRAIQMLNEGRQNGSRIAAMETAAPVTSGATANNTQINQSNVNTQKTVLPPPAASNPDPTFRGMYGGGWSPMSA